MSETATAEQEHVAELMARIGDRYLLLIRENYLDDPGGLALRDYLVGSLRGLMHTGRFSCVYNLACSQDWREAVVGLHYAVILACPAFDLARPGRATPKAYHLLASRIGDKYENDLRNSKSFIQPLSTRPAFLLFVMLNRRNFIVDFLATIQNSCDAADIHAAALVSEELTRDKSSTKKSDSSDREASEWHERVISLLRGEPGHDESEFADSKERFRQSGRYWTKQNLS